MKRLTDDEKLEVIKHHKEGKTLKNISQIYGVSVTAIFYVVNPEKVRRVTGAQVSDSIKKSRLNAISLLGGVCKRCGFSDPRALQIDHIKGGGNREFKAKGNYFVYLKIVKNFNVEKNNYQVLCANCNWIKRYENKEVKNVSIYS